jgi:L-aspartate oxidase
MKISGTSHVFLDCKHINYEDFKNNFPTILEKCKSVGIDIRKDMIPVTPAAHYLCGGVSVDLNGMSSIHNLFACGECTHTGLHGANRLASNSLLEAVVYSNQIFEYLKNTYENLEYPKNIPNWDDFNTAKNKKNILITHNKQDVKNIMSNYVGIVRSNDCLQRAEKRLYHLYKETEDLYKEFAISENLCELRNLITTAYLITQFSVKRKENIGGFFNEDIV